MLAWVFSVLQLQYLWHSSCSFCINVSVLSVVPDASLLSSRIIWLSWLPAEVSLSQTLNLLQVSHYHLDSSLKLAHSHSWEAVKVWQLFGFSFHLWLLLCRFITDFDWKTKHSQQLRSVVKPPVFKDNVTSDTWKLLLLVFCALIFSWQRLTGSCGLCGEFCWFVGAHSGILFATGVDVGGLSAHSDARHRGSFTLRPLFSEECVDLWCCFFQAVIKCYYKINFFLKC